MKKLVLSSILFLSLNVYANGCPGHFDPQSGICRFQGHNGQMVQYNAAPPQSSNVATTPRKIIRHIEVNVPSKYGALALNTKTGVVSGVLNRNSEAEAKKAAIQQCKANTPKASCKLAGMVKNGCLAAASGKIGNTWSLYKAAEKPGLAEQSAMHKCKADGAKDCKIIMPEGCSIPDTSQY